MTEREKRLEEALEHLWNAVANLGIRSLVAGWNGEGQEGGHFNHRHPLQLGATLKTTCGVIYEIDKASIAARAALSVEEKGEAEAVAWQPIKTAPKDGTEVLIWLAAPYSRIEKARWYTPWANWQAGCLPIDPVRDEMHGIGSAVPTHWRPLPAPPSTNEVAS